MKIVALEPHTQHLTLAVVEGTVGDFRVLYKDEWSVDTTDRACSYSVIRARLVENIEHWKPDLVCIVQLSSYSLKRAKPTISWFHSAELRGVVAEASHSASFLPIFLDNSAISRKLDAGPLDQILKSAVFWNERCDGTLQKKYRHCVLMAVSQLERD